MNNDRSDWQLPVLKELVVNYFVTERCNFNCAICYSKWQDMHSDILENQFKLLEALYEFLKPSTESNPCTQYFRWNTVRINFSGGEPFLVKQIDQLIHYARKLGFRTSVTTNGSLLYRDMIQKIAPDLAWIGFSVDACNVEASRQMGRADKRGYTVSLDDIKEKVDEMRAINPQIKLKINTTVSVYNLDQDFSTLINILHPDKWTVVQALPIINKTISVSDTQFSTFVDRHQCYRPIAETIDDFTESFFLVTPEGRFFSNGEALQTGYYRYSEKINQVGAKQAFSEVNFNRERFLARYQKNQPFLYL
ncbi:MAG: hypothetical protein A2103_01360 [Gammaproteobacteria bacterium GWF2_41_13]|nr:MAG: hypothetical protein A2103_01360 [Gammaproteobacteria bacterium GWF2_41_13]